MTPRDPSSVEVLERPHDMWQVAVEWNRLALLGGSPYFTVQWLVSWWESFGDGVVCLLLRAPDGRLTAGACCRRQRWRRLRSATNVETGDWDVVAADVVSREAMWEWLARSGVDDLRFAEMNDHATGSGVARRVLTHAGFTVTDVDVTYSPYVVLPESWVEFMSSRSRNLRSQVGRRKRGLERAGALRFRTTSGGPEMERDLDAFLRVEASGWKGRAGTAITSDRRTDHLYRSFAQGIAREGWLRLHLLELDGALIAGDLGCSFGDGGFLIKTAYDERYASLSPGLVLRGEALRAAIDEGSSFYDFLGGAESYKLRWADETRPRVTIAAYRGPWKVGYASMRSLRRMASTIRVGIGDLRGRVSERSRRGRASEAPAGSQAPRS